MNDQSRIEGGNGRGPTTETEERVPGESPYDADDAGAEHGEGEGEVKDEEVKDEEVKDEDEIVQELSRDSIFDALENSRRRQVLRYLDEHGAPVKLGDLAEHVAAIENDTTPDALDSAQRQRVYISLYQSHLPKLDDMGIIDFHQERGRVEMGSAASQLDPYLSIEEDDDRPWYSYHVAFTAICTLAVLLGIGTGLVGTASAALLVVVGTSVAFLVAVLALDRSH